jgi:tetratricopeptide (TPR) repeat protein
MKTLIAIVSILLSSLTNDVFAATGPNCIPSSQAGLAYESAHALVVSGKWKEAIRAFEDLADRERIPAVWIYQAYALAKLGSFELSIKLVGNARRAGACLTSDELASLRWLEDAIERATDVPPIYRGFGGGVLSVPERHQAEASIASVRSSQYDKDLVEEGKCRSIATIDIEFPVACKSVARASGRKVLREDRDPCGIRQAPNLRPSQLRRVLECIQRYQRNEYFQEPIEGIMPQSQQGDEAGSK